MDISLTYVLLICKTKTFYLKNCMSYLHTQLTKTICYVKNEPNRAKSRVNMYRLFKKFRMIRYDLDHQTSFKVTAYSLTTDTL